MVGWIRKALRALPGRLQHAASHAKAERIILSRDYRAKRSGLIRKFFLSGPGTELSGSKSWLCGPASVRYSPAGSTGRRNTCVLSTVAGRSGPGRYVAGIVWLTYAHKRDQVR